MLAHLKTQNHQNQISVQMGVKGDDQGSKWVEGGVQGRPRGQGSWGGLMDFLLIHEACLPVYK